MAEALPRDVLMKVRKLAQLPEEARHCQFAVNITRLTSLKSLCQEPEVARRFVTYMTRKALENAEQGKRRSGSLTPKQRHAHREMMEEALEELEDWPAEPGEADRRRLWDLRDRMRAEQNEHQSIPFGAVRLIRDWELLIAEKAIQCVLHPREAGHLAYEIARDYTERYDGRYGTGLIPKSAPLVQDIVDFWIGELGIDKEALAAPARAGKARSKGTTSMHKKKGAHFTPRQGQFLAFIHLYRKLHRRGPAETDLKKFFRVTPPAVHDMIVKLEELGLITREPGVARSARVAIPEAEVPELEEVPGPPW